MSEKILLLKVCAAVGVSGAFFLAGCGDTVNEYNSSGVELVSSEDDLPKCTEDNEGEQAVVKGETSIRVCLDGEWTAMSSDEPSAGLNCKTEELKDKSGHKIVCNDDSIGVVLNGSDGKTGTDCAISGQTDSAITVVCGDSTIVIVMKIDTAAADSEKIAISLDSLVGYTQKGPFLKGSSVYLYELSDGRTLKQTNGNFSSLITRDDGRYKFLARDLVSQYAMVVVDGYYRNEVTGTNSKAPIRLKALTDMRKHSNVNVNLLTHMEFDRVYYLVTRGDSTGKKLTVRQAKRQAQREILREFYIELGENTDAEDMDVFGDSDADAALLAISILLQGDRNETGMTVLLTEIANAIAEDGTWDGAKADSLKAAIADWALMQDSANTSRLAQFRQNVGNWGLSKTVPEFEKLVRNFASIESGLGECGSDSIPQGTVKNVPNAESVWFAKVYTDTSITKARFICADASLARWRLATDLEKDRFGWKPDNTKDGTLLTGPITGRKMVWDANTLRYADSAEIGWKRGCVSYNRDSSVLLDDQYSYYKCGNEGWEFDFEHLNTGTMTDARDGRTYKTVGIKTQVWMAENLNYTDSVATPSLKGKSWCYGDTAADCANYGRLYTWAAAIDSVKLATVGENPMDCGYGKTCNLPDTVQGICPEGWHLPSLAEYNTLFEMAGGMSDAGGALKSTTGWKADGNGSDRFGFTALPVGGVSYGSSYAGPGFNAFFWSSTDDNGVNAYLVNLSNITSKASVSSYDEKNFKASVRCIRN